MNSLRSTALSGGGAGVSARRLSVAVLGLVLAAVLALSGCGRKPADQGKIRIRFWTFPVVPGVTGKEKNPRPDDWPRFMCREFQKKHPEVEFDIEVLTWQGGPQKMDLAVLSKTYPDIAYGASSNRSKYVDQGVLEPIDPYLTKEDLADFYPNILDTCRYKGKTYLWPWVSNALVLVVNTDIFKERGVENLLPKGPDRSWTYDQFLAACKACTFKRADGTPVYGYALYGIPLTVEYQMLTLVLGFGAKAFSPDGSQFLLNSPEGVRGFSFLVDLLDKYKVVPPSPAGMNAGQVGTLFGKHQLAIESGVPATLKQLQKAMDRKEVEPLNAILVQPPHLPGKDPVTMLSCGGYVVFKQKDKRKRDLLMEFARFLTSTENARYLVLGGQFPCRKSAGGIYGNDADMRVCTSLIPKASIYFTNTAPELQPVINNIYQKIFTHARTPAQALADAEREAREIIARDAADRKPARR